MITARAKTRGVGYAIGTALFGGILAVVLTCLSPSSAWGQTPVAQTTVPQTTAQSYPTQHIYPSVDASPANIRAALAEARRTGKRVLLDFGGDWCPDCQVLNIYLNQSPNRELVDKYYIRVNVNIGHEDANVDIAHQYGVPLTGVPALAVTDGHGKVIYAQDKQFSDMRHMQSADLTAFLNAWKPQSAHR